MLFDHTHTCRVLGYSPPSPPSSSRQEAEEEMESPSIQHSLSPSRQEEREGGRERVMLAGTQIGDLFRECQELVKYRMHGCKFLAS